MSRGGLTPPGRSGSRRRLWELAQVVLLEVHRPPGAGVVDEHRADAELAALGIPISEAGQAAVRGTPVDLSVGAVDRLDPREREVVERCAPLVADVAVVVDLEQEVAARPDRDLVEGEGVPAEGVGSGVGETRSDGLMVAVAAGVGRWVAVAVAVGSGVVDSTALALALDRSIGVGFSAPPSRHSRR